MKKYILNACKVFSCGFIITGLLAAGLFYADDEILFQSKESKTLTGEAVYNKIKLVRSQGRDIWLMNQSHEGMDSKNWDRLAIIVKDNEATFLQLPPGKLEWSEDLLKQSIPSRVSCFTCHSNGPRAIRAEETSSVLLNLKSQAKIFLWNFRIKSYGRIKESQWHAQRDLKLQRPFRLQSKRDNEVLSVRSCLQCHNNEGFFARGNLTRQNADTIKFMLDQNLMPPLGFTLSKKERKEIENFVQGF